MLFNSYAFIFLFLPLFLLAWQLTPANRLLTLFAFSAAFYALWGLPWLLLLGCLIMLNYSLGKCLAWNEPGEPDPDAPALSVLSRKATLVMALILNLLPLIWFKYSAFIFQNLALLSNADWDFIPPPLPLGISFYSFIQIAWLVELYRGNFQLPTLTEYATFSGCFPYVISGPIVRYEQLGWQLQTLKPLAAENLAMGFTLFSIGLAKKAILADSIGFYANAVFNAASQNWPLTMLEAWFGSLAYTFQLYFDFSGYTDMAIGLGLMIGLRLPENFNAPYRSTGIVDFWRRWHITLSSWLRDFLYIPMGGNRKGRPAQYRNLFLTMLIGGAWHGAGWTYILWGALHGFMLCINHYFRALIRGSGIAEILAHLPARIFFIILTFFCINFCWVLFRATSLEAALTMYTAMFSGPLTNLASDAGGGAMALANIFLPNRYIQGWQPLALLGLCACICWFLPTSQAFLTGQCRWLTWKPNARWATAMALLAFVALAMLSRQTTFLYFQF